MSSLRTDDFLKVGGGLPKIVSPKIPKHVPERPSLGDEEGHIVTGHLDGTHGPFIILECDCFYEV